VTGRDDMVRRGKLSRQGPMPQDVAEEGSTGRVLAAAPGPEKRQEAEPAAIATR